MKRPSPQPPVPDPADTGSLASLAAQIPQGRILLVDDEASNLAVLRRALSRAGYGRLEETTDPRQVRGLFREFRPDLVCLDLYMEPLDGFAVLEQLAPLIPPDGYLPILMLTGESSPAVKQKALALGAKDFVTKPFDLEEVLLRIHNLLFARLLYVRLLEQNRSLEDRVRLRTRDLEQARLEVLERLGLAAEFRDDDTGEHVRRVGRTAALLAGTIGLNRATVELIERAAPLHDLGKIGIPDPVLLKPGRLTPEEFTVMKRHPAIGAQILSGGTTPLMRMAEEIALAHHERWDGSGYPGGLAGESIPLPARIVALADVFDALAHSRPYRDAWPLRHIVREFTEQAGRQFDAGLVPVFLRLPLDRMM